MSKLDTMVSRMKGKTIKNPNLLFAEKSQMLRWFHERDLNELKAMRKGFELVLQQQAQKGDRA
jgi:hypothetical protein